MQPGKRISRGAMLLAPAVLVVGVLAVRGQADEPSRLSRLFRFGSSSSAGSGSPSSSSSAGVPSTAPGAIVGGLTPSSPAGSIPATTANGPSSTAPTRIVARPRTTRPATEADPIVTRIALGRSNEGGQFGMFLQVFADGTVLDSEGEHHVGRETLRPIVEALQASELYRMRGHCGAPSTDFIEQVHMVVYERSLGRLRANSFSYSGNPQNCDHAVLHLHNALEALQQKISRSATAAAPTSVPAAGAPNTAAPAPPYAAPHQGPTITLTPGQ